MRQSKYTVMGFLVFVLLLMVITLVASSRLRLRLEAGESRIVALEQAIEQETARTEEIREMEEYMRSDAYTEQVAKDKLGLIRDGEIIFKESAKD